MKDFDYMYYLICVMKEDDVTFNSNIQINQNNNKDNQQLEI